MQTMTYSCDRYMQTMTYSYAAPPPNTSRPLCPTPHPHARMQLYFTAAAALAAIARHQASVLGGACACVVSRGAESGGRAGDEESGKTGYHSTECRGGCAQAVVAAIEDTVVEMLEGCSARGRDNMLLVVCGAAVVLQGLVAAGSTSAQASVTLGNVRGVLISRNWQAAPPK